MCQIQTAKNSVSLHWLPHTTCPVHFSAYATALLPELHSQHTKFKAASKPTVTHAQQSLLRMSVLVACAAWQPHWRCILPNSTRHTSVPPLLVHCVRGQTCPTAFILLHSAYNLREIRRLTSLFRQTQEKNMLTSAMIIYSQGAATASVTRIYAGSSRCASLKCSMHVWGDLLVALLRTAANAFCAGSSLIAATAHSC
jgi:hypothetical protein